MTLVRKATIPSEFIRFDSYVTDADSHNNVRDAQVARENLNVLIARRLRHPILAVRGRSAYYENYDDYIAGFGALQIGQFQPGVTWLGPWRIWIPPFCKALTIRLRAAASSNDGDVVIYPCLGVTGPNAGYVITVTGNTLDEYELDIPTPSSYSGAAYFTDLRLYVTCESYGNDVDGTIFVIDPSTWSPP